jgi:hypothetical protein
VAELDHDFVCGLSHAARTQGQNHQQRCAKFHFVLLIM